MDYENVREALKDAITMAESESMKASLYRIANLLGIDDLYTKE